MAYIILVQFLVLIFMSLPLSAKIDRIHAEGLLGEKRLDSYAERYRPHIFMDMYQGKLEFKDDLFFKHYFENYLLAAENDLSFFLKSELNAGAVCPNELLSEHFDDVRFSYRLITLSYLLEGQWHLKLLGEHFGMKTCSFDMKKWLRRCRGRTPEMIKFIERLKKHHPENKERLPADYGRKEWWDDYTKQNFRYYSHYKMEQVCGKGCSQESIAQELNQSCRENSELMELICSEQDDVYGLSDHRDAYYLLGLSNIINTFNKQGEALGCMKRFSELMAHKEVHYTALKNLFPSLQTQLRKNYQERFLQGRVFFYGSTKEFEEKGLSDVFVVEQALKIEPLKIEEPSRPVTIPLSRPVAPVKVITKTAPVVVSPPKKEVVEVKEALKSAFLQASELRRSQKLKKVEVDMLKFKYDYVFSLHLINKLSSQLKNFMTRDALQEMKSFDKLGTKDGPVPLLFLKYMIDMQEHQGLYNILGVLGDKFYVSNEIDEQYKPGPELVQLTSNQSSGHQWQLYILDDN